MHPVEHSNIMEITPIKAYVFVLIPESIIAIGATLSKYWKPNSAKNTISKSFCNFGFDLICFNFKKISKHPCDSFDYSTESLLSGTIKTKTESAKNDNPMNLIIYEAVNSYPVPRNS